MKSAIFKILFVPLLAAAMLLMGVEREAYAAPRGGHAGHFAGRGGGGFVGHRGGGHFGHGGGHFRGGVFIGGPWFFDPFFYPFYPYYAYPYAPSPTVVIEQREPQEYIMNGPPPEQHYWYYCKESRGYYPNVKRCPGGWMKVVPTPPSDTEPYDTEPYDTEE